MKTIDEIANDLKQKWLGDDPVFTTDDHRVFLIGAKAGILHGMDIAIERTGTPTPAPAPQTNTH